MLHTQRSHTHTRIYTHLYGVVFYLMRFTALVVEVAEAAEVLLLLLHVLPNLHNNNDAEVDVVVCCSCLDLNNSINKC